MNNDAYVKPMPTLSPEMTIFELIDADPSLLSIFARLEIKLPFGDMTVEQICRRDGFSDTLFLELCRLCINGNYRPNAELFEEYMLPQVVHFLRASHRYYINEMLPHAAEHLDEILASCDDLSKSTLSRFYQEYVRFVEAHLAEEERDLFSVIEGGNSASLSRFDDIVVPHTDIDDRTNDIASLIFKCLPERASTALRCAMLSDIYALRDDLRRHNDVEMYLLRPMIEKFISSK